MARGQTPFSELFPPLPPGFQEPFWYASLQSFWLYYRVATELLAERLPELPQGEGLEVARFDFGDGQEAGLVSLDFQRYTGHGPGYLETANEVEFNLYAYPQAREPDVPLMTWQQYLLGEDQTKTIGGYRLHVPCDNPTAVKAGRGLYGEPKYSATFTCAVPCLNGPPSPPSSAWSYQVYADPSPSTAPPAQGTPDQGPLIYGLECDLAGIAPVPANQSPLIEYGVFTDDGGGVRLVGNHWDFYGPFDTYIATGLQAQITPGSEDDPTGTVADLEQLIGDAQPIAAQVYTSPPASAESRGWFPVPAR